MVPTKLDPTGQCCQYLDDEPVVIVNADPALTGDLDQDHRPARVELSGTPSFRTLFLKFLEEVLDLYKVLAGNGLGGKLRERSMERALERPWNRSLKRALRAVDIGLLPGGQVGDGARAPG